MSNSLSFNVDNLFDKRYAVEVKGTGADTTYSAGAPRTAHEAPVPRAAVAAGYSAAAERGATYSS